ncbi:membrane protein insertion efficiency factor YidD [Lentisphaera profundi]|uniref:Putative membrane protein insertion efficiency factor n=1 Tax=Lentisphaera profundi TaxID=1658616 RepID=A0ABY7W1X0_9BACT|nr:membrane protein insertion efficiency factor YidD [Lentisphaera profundi]WDE99473.1 membrane protein insertion efficiency factor YidD [Lentisphaera profundi]
MAAHVAILLVTFYKKCLSPLFPATCRFEPTCSMYSSQALSTHGFLRGLWLTTKRILKCHPFYRGSSCDPVPGKDVTNKEK